MPLAAEDQRKYWTAPSNISHSAKNNHPMTKRVLAGIFGAVIFGILVPVLYSWALSVPGTMGLVGLALIGVVGGAFVGARFPCVFGFPFEALLDV